MAYHTGQVTPFKCAADCSLLAGRQTKPAIVKHHRIYDKASGFLAKKLDAVTVFIDEDEHISVAQICRHLVVHNAAQHMKALTHVGRLCEQPVPHAVI